MALIRVQQTVQTTLAHIFAVGKTPTDPTGTPTVAVKRLDGTSVASGNANVIGGATGRVEFALTGQANLDTFTVDWTATVAGSTRTERDIVEIAGAFIFELAEAYDELKLDALKYPLDDVAAKRVAVEQECEAIRRQAQVPRFARFLLDGTGTEELVAPDLELRTLRAAKVADRAGGTFTALTADQVAAVAAEPSGVLIRDDGDTWPRGRRNVIVEYEYGLDLPSQPVRDAAMFRLRSMLSTTRTQVPDRAVSFTFGEGGLYRLAAAGPRSTGIPEVDAAYLRDANARVWIA